MPRQARLDAPGTLHNVMLRGIERRAIVTDDGPSRVCQALGSLGHAEPNVGLWLGLVDQSYPPAATQRSRWVTPVDAPLSDRVCPSLRRRHQRHGHLFQNRYKSIVCEEDRYFVELLRYIISPLRARLVRP